MQLNSQPELGIGDSSVPSLDDEEELEDPAFPDTITTSAQTSDQSAPLPFTHSVSPDGVYSPDGGPDQDFEPENDPIPQTERAAILDLPESGTSRKKNIKTGLLKEGKLILE
jgi:hypothetical protein